MSQDSTGAGFRGFRDTAQVDMAMAPPRRTGPVAGAALAEHRTGPVQVTGLVEKPPADEAPSSLAIIGRYVLAPEIFDALRETKPGRGGEIQLTDALAALVEQGEPVHGVVFSGRRYDTGDRLDYLKAVVRLAVERDDLGPPLRSWLREFVSDLPAEGASPS